MIDARRVCSSPYLMGMMFFYGGGYAAACPFCLPDTARPGMTGFDERVVRQWLNGYWDAYFGDTPRTWLI